VPGARRQLRHRPALEMFLVDRCDSPDFADEAEVVEDEVRFKNRGLQALREG
jgi:hypothetical protein